jgi:hypothetical protein
MFFARALATQRLWRPALDAWAPGRIKISKSCSAVKAEHISNELAYAGARPAHFPVVTNMPEETSRENASLPHRRWPGFFSRRHR